MELSLGKRRRLQQTAGPDGAFTVLAIDHRGPLRRQLAPTTPDRPLDDLLADIKRDIVRALGPLASAVLLDPELGLEACVTHGDLPGSTGLLVALDTGSTGDPANVRTGLAEGWNVARIARSGASGVKLLVYYHPDAPQAPEIERLVRDIAADCAREEIPLFLEPLSYSPEDPSRRLPPPERRRVVIETARRLVPLGVDILKAEFPVHPADSPDETEWDDACRELTDASSVPWVLLSAGVTHDVFLRQTDIACRAGARGVIAGRALWSEAITPDPDARRRFLEGPARRRLEAVRALCHRGG